MNLPQAYITEESNVLKNNTQKEKLAVYCHPESVESTQKTGRLTQEALKS